MSKQELDGRLSHEERMRGLVAIKEADLQECRANLRLAEAELVQSCLHDEQVIHHSHYDNDGEGNSWNWDSYRCQMCSKEILNTREWLSHYNFRVPPTDKEASRLHDIRLRVRSCAARVELLKKSGSKDCTDVVCGPCLVYQGHGNPRLKLNIGTALAKSKSK